MYEKFKIPLPSEAEMKKFGHAHSWSIDLVPKFLMANGELTSIISNLIPIGNAAECTTGYLEIRQIDGSYVQQGSGSRATVDKVPSNAQEALSSKLMGLFEKRRARAFLEWVGNFQENDPATHNGEQ